MRVLSFLIGATIAFAAWWFGAPAYNILLSQIIRHSEAIDRTIRVTWLGAPTIQIPADMLTYNIILFVGLVVAMPPRRPERLLLAIAVLIGTHVLALLASIEATYAMRAGAWSRTHYTPFEQDFWKSVDFVYRIAGMFAIAFVCWYATIAAPGPRPETSKKSGKVRPIPRRAAKSRP